MIDVSEIMEFLYSKAGFFCFTAGFVSCMLCDCLFAVANYFVERGLTTRDFRSGRLLPFEWLQDYDIRYFVARQIYDMDFKTGAVQIEKQDEALDHLKRKYKDKK